MRHDGHIGEVWARWVAGMMLVATGQQNYNNITHMSNKGDKLFVNKEVLINCDIFSCLRGNLYLFSFAARRNPKTDSLQVLPADHSRRLVMHSNRQS